MKSYTTIDEYIASFPASTQKLLEELRRCIQNAAPEATEKISYGIPTFFLKKNLVHFGGYPKHIGFYPGASGVAHFKDKLKNYKTSKGTIQFQIEEPLPLKLVDEITRFRVAENLTK